MIADTLTTLETHQPPYDLTADFLFVIAPAATAPLRRSFPGVSFLSIFGKIPLILWFSQITETCYYDPNKQRHCERGTDQVPYAELNVVTMLTQKAFFVPKIYASRPLTVQIASLYAMPKMLHSLAWSERKGYVSSTLTEDGHQSLVQARVLKGGQIGPKLLSFMWPLTLWPALFPADSSIRAVIQNVPSIQLALIQKGQLSLPEPWLPDPVSFFPLGLYLPQLTMTLPPPWGD